VPRSQLHCLPLLLAAFGATAFGAAACSGSDDGKKNNKPTEPPLVRVAAAELRQVQREILTPGFLESEHQDQVAAAIGGKLRRVCADEGTNVNKGDLLAEVDDREAVSARDQLVVQRDGKQVDRDLADLEVEAGGRRIAQADIERQKSKAEFDRQSQMSAEYVSPKALQEAELAFHAAEEAGKLASFLERKSKLEVKRIDNSIAELDAKIRELDVRIEHHRVTAPFTGVVTKRHVVEGATIAAGAVLFDMVDPEHLVAWLDRPQNELDLVRQAKEVTFKADALPGRTFTGDVDLISPVIDRQTGHFRLRMRVRAADSPTLVHGMFVRARILAESLREALMVPKAAVLSEGDVSVVMVVRDGKAMRVGLDPGLEQQDEIECKNRGDSGLKPGDLVITSGHEDLKDQSPVAVAPGQAQRSTPAATAVPAHAAPADAAVKADGVPTPAPAQAPAGPSATGPSATGPSATKG
jgi:multidrug efflux pump subunit AcrA (membrane-fusion protein)